MTIVAQSGSLCYWSLGQQTDPDRLLEGLELLGLPKYAPSPRTWLASLKAGLGEMFAKPEELVRPLKNKERSGYTVVIESKGEDSNGYDNVVHASVSSEGAVDVHSGWGRCDNYQLQQLTNRYRRMLPASSVAATLVEIVGGPLCGVPMKPSGGLYFVPESNVETWQAVARVVESAAADGYDNEVSTVPFVLNGSTLRDIRRSITAEVVAAANELADDLAQNERGEAALCRRAYRALKLRQRTTEYEQILGETLGTCREALQTAMQAFSVATAIKDDAEVFADVF